METISIDIETFSDVNLAECGVYKYAQSPDFEILLFGYSVDGGAIHVVDLANCEKIPDKILKALSDDSVIKWAFNANFERICLSEYLNRYYPEYFQSYSINEDTVNDYLDPASWRCTMIWSAYLGLPLSLKGVGAVLKLDAQKMDEGKELIKYFCVPCVPTKSNGGRLRNYPHHDPEKWELFKKYNKCDVEVELAIKKKLTRFPVPEFVWEEYHLDQQINDRGIAVDMKLVSQAVRLDEKCRTESLERAGELTGLDNPNSPVQLLEWLNTQGVHAESLDKKTVQELLKTATGKVREVLLLRQQLSKSSVKKYTAMNNVACDDSRARGCFQFYGANRTGRWSGRNIQLQNLPQNHIPDLEQARNLVKSGNYEALDILYNNIPDTLSQLIRTAFVPRKNMKFIVADFSAIEARVIAWLAGERWRMEAFAKGEDIYCASASKMFGVPVVKHGVNGELRTKGKISELACIAEGQLVLTDKGLVPIEKITTDMKVWDGEEWVQHDGVVYRGEREVITYEGLTATPDHIVWVEGEHTPICLEEAARSGTHLLQTGIGRNTLRMGDYCKSGIQMGNRLSLLYRSKMCRLWNAAMDGLLWFKKRKTKILSRMLESSSMVEISAKSCKTPMRKLQRPGIQKLRRSGYSIRFYQCESSWNVDCKEFRNSRQEIGIRPYRLQRELRPRKYQICNTACKCKKQKRHCVDKIRAAVLAIRVSRCDKKIGKWNESERHHSRCCKCSEGTQSWLETDSRTARVYDIRNAGQHHRFTVSGKLVHNCGYGGASGAMKAMGADAMGLSDNELKQIVADWREASPNIVKLWWDVDHAVKECIRLRLPTETHGLKFSYESGFLFIELPSGRRLAYVKPRIEPNQFGGESVTYEGVGTTKKWERLESYGSKFVENCIAKGTIVITDKGFVRIEDITAEMKVWDGVEFVSHDGLIIRGMKETISVNGIHMTSEHKILTEKGWIECGKACGFNWADVSLPDRFRESLEQQARKSTLAMPMHMRKYSNCKFEKFKRQKISCKIMWLYEIFLDKCCKKNTWHESSSSLGSMAFDETTLFRPESPDCVQGIARDLLMNSMQNLRNYNIVAHIHDELIIECPLDTSLSEICEIMGKTPEWADGLVLRADGYECEFYRKD